VVVKIGTDTFFFLMSRAARGWGLAFNTAFWLGRSFADSLFE
jgi:hypothetical protein